MSGTHKFSYLVDETRELLEGEPTIAGIHSLVERINRVVAGVESGDLMLDEAYAVQACYDSLLGAGKAAYESGGGCSGYDRFSRIVGSYQDRLASKLSEEDQQVFLAGKDDIGPDVPVGPS